MPWSVITMDLLTGLTETSRGFDSGTVFVDRLTKMARFCPCTKTISAAGMADLFVQNIFCLRGLPAIIISDRDLHFTSRFWDERFATLGTNLRLGAAFHSQTGGQSERTDRTLVEMLRGFVDGEMVDWDLQLPLIEFAYNSAVATPTGCSPFRFLYGCEPGPPRRMIGGLQSSTANTTAVD